MPASILLEILIQAVGIPEGIVDRLWFLIIALVFSTFVQRERNAGGGGSGSQESRNQPGQLRGQENGFDSKVKQRQQQGPFGFS